MSDGSMPLNVTRHISLGKKTHVHWHGMEWGKASSPLFVGDLKARKIRLRISQSSVSYAFKELRTEPPRPLRTAKTGATLSRQVLEPEWVQELA
jgi:hypothetical protein